ncbi:MAG: hypothetical protein HY855_06370 [Burkholderiales bacterium]|nr:hypothetical protein [Burkholderiales bacterium]
MAAQSQAQAEVLAGEILTLSEARASVKVGGVNRAVSVPPGLARQLGLAQDYFFVGKTAVESGNARYLLLVLQTPSTTHRGVGHCGAGTEDILRVLAFERAALRLVQRGQLVLQSCLDSLSLSDDTGASLRERMESIAKPDCLRLQWLGHPKYGEEPVALHVYRGKLVQGCGVGNPAR